MRTDTQEGSVPQYQAGCVGIGVISFCGKRDILFASFK